MFDSPISTGTSVETSGFSAGWQPIEAVNTQAAANKRKVIRMGCFSKRVVRKMLLDTHHHKTVCTGFNP
jgi:hypothetical protein